MPSFVQDLELVELVLGDVASFAAGQPVSASRSIGGQTYNATVQTLPNGPVAPFQTFSGSFISVFEVVVADVAAVAAGAPIAVAEKIGNTWYGLTLSAVAAPPAPPTSA